MKKTKQPIPSKEQYEAPNIDVIQILYTDIITTSEAETEEDDWSLPGLLP